MNKIRRFFSDATNAVCTMLFVLMVLIVAIGAYSARRCSADYPDNLNYTPGHELPADSIDSITRYLNGEI